MTSDVLDAGGPARPPRLPRWRGVFSLRGRLLLGLMLLTAIGLTVAAIATRTLLASFLLSRFDAQQSAASRLVAQAVFSNDGGPGRPSFGGGSARRAEASRLLPTGSYAAAMASDGTLVEQFTYDSDEVWVAADSGQAPVLPADAASRAKPFTVRSASGAQYRVLVQPGLLVNPATGDHYAFVWAMPLREIDQTLGRLTLVEAAVAAAVLVGLGLVAWFAIGIGLRPLRKMEVAADEIAAGHLSRRVEDADARTEVGRLGLALNTMLGRIEDAFAARAASEERLRRFLADASHELRTPLTSIRGYAELFRRGAARRPDDLEKAMRRIEDESARMGVLVDELLLLARLDQGREPAREPVLLAELVADACDDLRTAAPDRVVSVDADPDVVVSGDEMQLRQVVGNLLTNARVHTPAGSPIDVRLATAGSVGVLEVTDHGRGLPAAELEQVFDRFYRADRSRARDQGGAGLGLSIVAAVVQAHGGRVGVSNAPTAGARFRVELPLLGGDPLPGPVAPDWPAEADLPSDVPDVSAQ